MTTRKKRIVSRLNTGLTLVLAVLIALMVNYLSFQLFVRKDLSATRMYTLSDRTVSMLNRLDRPVQVTVFFQPDHLLYEDIHNLLREYQFHSRHLQVQWVDPNRDLALTEELAARYGVTEPNVVVFDSRGRNKYVRSDEIAVIDASSGIERVVALKGEQAFSSAILTVISEAVPSIYFLTGHGQRDIHDFDRRTGFSGVARLLERDNLDVKQLLLSRERQIPDDCAVLVIAGATHSMSRAEADLIGAWLRRGGRLMVLADAGRTIGIESLLREWGVVLRDDLVIDLERTLTGREVVVSAYNSRHPITARLGTTAAIFHRPRSVEPDYERARPDAVDRPQAEPLAFSSEKSWSETQLDQSPPRFDEGTDDLRGPISLAVAVERGAATELLDIQLRPSRVVVFGDSGFVSNGGLTGGDISLFMSSLNWLLDRDALMAVAPREVEDVRLHMTRSDLRKLRRILVGVIPAAVLIPGVLLWIIRKRQT